AALPLAHAREKRVVVVGADAGVAAVGGRRGRRTGRGLGRRGGRRCRRGGRSLARGRRSGSRCRGERGGRGLRGLLLLHRLGELGVDRGALVLQRGECVLLRLTGVAENALL